MSKEGLGTVVGLAVFAIVPGYLFVFHANTAMAVLFVLVLILLGFAVYFFRDPVRVVSAKKNEIVAPADGRVIEIENVNETEFAGECVRISIFLSLFDVHVNYVPCDGTVDFIKYSRGKYYRADTDAASRHNVSIIVGLETSFGKMAFKQLTGLLARRIVCRLKLGNQVYKGQKYGIIKFGSRLEVYLPHRATVLVDKGDRLRAAESVIAKVHED